MAKLALAKDFLTSFHELTPKQRARVVEIARMFNELTPQELNASKGIHLERHNNAADPRARTIRIDDNHRGIVLDGGNNDMYVLVDIDTHDKTDRWMARNQFKVNAATGALEILDVGAIEAAAGQVEPSETKTLFEHRNAKEFTQLGVVAGLVPTLLVLTTEDQLTGLLDFLPPRQADAAICLLGNDSVETIFAEIAGRTMADDAAAPDPDDLAASVAAPASGGEFHVVTDDEDLSTILSLPLAQWRVYLHPSQKEMAYRPTYGGSPNASGAARVTGGAGTGKTVVAIHRAAALAEQVGDQSGKPILFTTFTRNLAKAIENDLRQLGGPDLLAKVEVRNIDQVAFRLVSGYEGSNARILNNPLRIWQEVVDELGTEYPPTFLNAEWEQVILAQGISSQVGYFKASRAGRGRPLNRRGRTEVWEAVEAFLDKLNQAKSRTHLQVADAAAGYLQGDSSKPYEHIIVDEAQDLHESHWRMLRAAVGEHPNDLFLVGDSHQRIYHRRSSLSKVGINIVGRSRKLRINYRTTRQILHWAMRVVGDESFDDLDDGLDRNDTAGYHSYLSGAEPIVEGHTARADELDAVVAQVRSWVDDGLSEQQIGVAARVNATLDQVQNALERGGFSVCRLPADDLPSKPGVRIGTMHRMKGLEFLAMALVGIDDRQMPLDRALESSADDPVQRERDLQRERCLLYVAATRARAYLWVGWAGKPSPFLPTSATD